MTDHTLRRILIRKATGGRNEHQCHKKQEKQDRREFGIWSDGSKHVWDDEEVLHGPGRVSRLLRHDERYEGSNEKAILLQAQKGCG
jgi:hypothetical protein